MATITTKTLSKQRIPSKDAETDTSDLLKVAYLRKRLAECKVYKDHIDRGISGVHAQGTGLFVGTVTLVGSGAQSIQVGCSWTGVSAASNSNAFNLLLLSRLKEFTEVTPALFPVSDQVGYQILEPIAATLSVNQLMSSELGQSTLDKSNQSNQLILKTPAFVPKFLKRLQELDKPATRDRAIDLINDRLDDLMLAGDFVQCDAIVREIDSEKLSAETLIAILTLTRAAAKHLPSRVNLFDKAQTRIATLLGRDRTQRILENLKF